MENQLVLLITGLEPPKQTAHLFDDAEITPKRFEASVSPKRIESDLDSSRLKSNIASHKIVGEIV